MRKQLSTYERKMKDTKFRKDYKKYYHELLLSELLISIMEGDNKSVRQLAKEAELSPSVIQDIRSGKQHDIKASNLIKIARAFGYEVMLQKCEDGLDLNEKNSDALTIRLSVQEDDTCIYALQKKPGRRVG